MLYTADFETTTLENDCRVWAYGICEIGNEKNFKYGNSIEKFIEWCSNGENNKVYFHNEKFDGKFILDWLLKHDYKFCDNPKNAENKTFTTIISDMGQFYNITIYFKKKGKHVTKVSIYDSLKILPFSITQIAKDFDLPISKLEIDYNEIREPGHELNFLEIEYLKCDVTIAAMALDKMFNRGLTKMTIGSNALYDYKNIVGKDKFLKDFPPPCYDKEMRLSYKGGYTYLAPRYKNKSVKNGIVLDVNSLYPWAMYYCKLPYGEGVRFEGEYKIDKIHDLYIQQFACQFELKPGMLPTLQIKNKISIYKDTEYLRSSKGNIETLTLTNVDLELFKDHYNVFNIEYYGGWKFKSSNKLFRAYIDKWYKEKVEGKLSKNKSRTTIAKLMLNSLYGKFALNPIVKSKYPYLDSKGIVKYKLMEEEQRTPIYIPVGTFITSQARNKTIRSAQKVYNRFMYADTDSLHLEGFEIPEELEISDTVLGAWKIESHFRKAKFIRQKCYMEDEIIDRKEYEKVLKEFNEEVKEGTKKYYAEKEKYYHLKITCAGMPESCYKYVTWKNFKEGTSYQGKLQPRTVPGGVILEDKEFTLKVS